MQLVKKIIRKLLSFYQRRTLTYSLFIKIMYLLYSILNENGLTPAELATDNEIIQLLEDKVLQELSTTPRKVDKNNQKYLLLFFLRVIRLNKQYHHQFIQACFENQVQFCKNKIIATLFQIPLKEHLQDINKNRIFLQNQSNSQFLKKLFIRVITPPCTLR
eukprot:TRINITY_DN28505_c0_g1_i1.p2 TRINITY_DN28505_c0_g1~~TRINITY_DN28505_c0_g1_i1.p2  ORF type:complete len:161 (-),score=12.83 TRINITY_DN28505_c0_g1_i1:3-485(-)